MLTVADCLRLAGQLQDVSDTPRLDIEVMLARLLMKERSWLYTWPESCLTEAQQAAFQRQLQRRKEGEPVAHIIGEREFWSLTLKVDNTTLIPRPETETLVEKALQLPLPDAAAVLDLGTGTGAIALALAAEKPDWHIVAVDAVPAAVALAQENTRRHRLQNVTVIESDWFSGLGSQRFDLIVSNPPYIDGDDPHLREGDVRFEPASALVAGENGCADLRQIVEISPNHLRSGGWLLLEHGYQQGEAVRKLLLSAGYQSVETGLDLAGCERISVGQLRPQR